METSCSGRPNFLSRLLASLSESLLRSASVPVTVFLAGVAAASSCDVTASSVILPYRYTGKKY